MLSGKVNMRRFVKCMKLKGQYWILLLRWGSAEQPTIDTKKYMITMILKRISWYRYQLIKNLHKILDKPLLDFKFILLQAKGYRIRPVEISKSTFLKENNGAYETQD